MHLNLTALLCLSLWQTAVRAGAEVRGIEILLYYMAYRIDVEVSSQLAIDEGKDPERTWKIAKSAINLPSDFPGGVVDTNRRGGNFHAFVSATASMGYAKATGVTRVADPWMPTWQEVRDIVHWTPIPKGSQYSYGGFNVKSMLGDLAGGEPNAVPGPDGKPTKNHFFDFDNMLAIIGKRAADLYDKNPDIARPYMQKISELSKLAAEGREKESAGYKIQNYKDALTEKNKQFDKKNPKSITGAVKTQQRESANFGAFQDIDLRETKKALKRQAGKNYDAFKDVATDLSKEYKKAEAAKDMEDIKKISGLDPQTKDHLRVHRQEIKLAEAIDLHLTGEASGACSYPGAQEPSNRRFRA